MREEDYFETVLRELAETNRALEHALSFHNSQGPGLFSQAGKTANIVELQGAVDKADRAVLRAVKETSKEVEPTPTTAAQAA